MPRSEPIPSRYPRHQHPEVHARRKARPAHPLRVELPARLLRELVKAALAQELVQSRVERVVQRPDRTGRDEQLLLPRPGHPAYRHRRHLSLRSLCTPNLTHSQRSRRTDFIHGLLVQGPRSRSRQRYRTYTTTTGVAVVYSLFGPTVNSGGRMSKKACSASLLSLLA